MFTLLQNYNNIPDDMRDDDETKADLHQTVDDLREKLWDICDERKEQAEAERERVMNDGWLEDRMGILSNHYITVMQVSLQHSVIDCHAVMVSLYPQ